MIACLTSAALGLSQINRLAAFKEARQVIHNRYVEAFAACPALKVPSNYGDQQPFWHLTFVIGVDWQLGGLTRSDFMDRARCGIGLQVHYIPLHLQPILTKARRGSDMSGARSITTRLYRCLVSQI